MLASPVGPHCFVHYQSILTTLPHPPLLYLAVYIRSVRLSPLRATSLTFRSFTIFHSPTSLSRTTCVALSLNPSRSVPVPSSHPIPPPLFCLLMFRAATTCFERLLVRCRSISIFCVCYYSVHSSCMVLHNAMRTARARKRSQGRVSAGVF
jgi:hypothetical protein